MIESNAASRLFPQTKNAIALDPNLHFDAHCHLSLIRYLPSTILNPSFLTRIKLNVSYPSQNALGVTILSKLLHALQPFSREDFLSRLATMLEEHNHASVEEPLAILKLVYAKDEKRSWAFIPMTMDLTPSYQCSAPVRFAVQADEIKILAAREPLLPFYHLNILNYNAPVSFRAAFAPGVPGFSGVKLYPALDNCTDPDKNDSAGFFQLIEQNTIPVTTHCATDGLYNPFFERAAHPKFDSRLSRSRYLTWDEAVMANSPEQWAPILEKFPDLIVNFAHFGGKWHFMRWLGCMVRKTEFNAITGGKPAAKVLLRCGVLKKHTDIEEHYLINRELLAGLGQERPEFIQRMKSLGAAASDLNAVYSLLCENSDGPKTWTAQIVRLMEHYPNVYADISFNVHVFVKFAFVGPLEQFKLKLAQSPLLAKRILGGSDFCFSQHDYQWPAMMGFIHDPRNTAFVKTLFRDNVLRFLGLEELAGKGSDEVKSG